MVKHKYSIGEIIAFFIAVLVIVFAVYRLGVIFEIVPKDFQPKEIAELEYNQLKNWLQKHSVDPGLVGQMSSSTLNKLHNAEKYIQEKIKQREIAQRIADKCKENDIFRFFMYLGQPTPESQECSKQNLRMKKAIDEIDGQNKPKPIQQQQQQQQDTTPQSDQMLDEQLLRQMQQQQEQLQPNGSVPTN